MHSNELQLVMGQGIPTISLVNLTPNMNIRLINRRPILSMNDLYLEVLTVHNSELRLFMDYCPPPPLLLISVLYVRNTSSSYYIFNVFSMTKCEPDSEHDASIQAIFYANAVGLNLDQHY